MIIFHFFWIFIFIQNKSERKIKWNQNKTKWNQSKIKSNQN